MSVRAPVRPIHGSGGFPPPDPPDFDRGPGGSGIPVWALCICAFLSGGIVANLLVLAPALIPWAVLAAVVGFCIVASGRRWR